MKSRTREWFGLVMPVKVWTVILANDLAQQRWLIKNGERMQPVMQLSKLLRICCNIFSACQWNCHLIYLTRADINSTMCTHTHTHTHTQISTHKSHCLDVDMEGT